MALARRPGGSRREWLVDARDGGRRMDLSWHRRERLIVLSLWQGGTCRATFRLPITDAPAIIALLSTALGDAANDGAVGGSGADRAEGSGAEGTGRQTTSLSAVRATRRWQVATRRIGHAWRRLCTRRRTEAEVVDLAAYRPR